MDERCKTFTIGSLHEIPMVMDELRLHHQVIIRLEGMGNPTSQRILDMLSGAAYVLKGSIRKTEPDTYVYTPGNL